MPNRAKNLEKLRTDCSIWGDVQIATTKKNYQNFRPHHRQSQLNGSWETLKRLLLRTTPCLKEPRKARLGDFRTPKAFPAPFCTQACAQKASNTTPTPPLARLERTVLSLNETTASYTALLRMKFLIICLRFGSGSGGCGDGDLNISPNTAIPPISSQTTASSLVKQANYGLRSSIEWNRRLACLN